MGQEHDDVDAQFNLVFDKSDDYLSAEKESILNQRYAAGILNIQTDYYNGDDK